LVRLFVWPKIAPARGTSTTKTNISDSQKDCRRGITAGKVALSPAVGFPVGGGDAGDGLEGAEEGTFAGEAGGFAHGRRWGDFYEVELPRLVRYAEQQERMISPEGTYPVLGRSMGYRFGALHVLSLVALLEKLPSSINPAQVRCALTAVIRRQMVKETFDKDGWLTLGFCGHQPGVAEDYVSTGSAYLCTFVYAALGLPADNPFWTAPAEKWSSQRVWSGLPIERDHSIR